MTLALLLAGCGPEPGTVEAARERAEEILDDHEDPDLAVVRVGIDDPERWAAVWGSASWGGVDLDLWLGPCAVPPGTRIEADLVVAPGAYPWNVVRQEGDLPDNCVWERLPRLPLDEPSARGQSDLYHLRWMAPPREITTVGSASQAAGRRTAERALVPPYVRWARFADGIDRESLRFEHGTVRYRGETDGALDRVDVSGVVPLLACPGPAPDLVRVAILFASGEVVEVRTEPHSECVESKIGEAQPKLARMSLGEGWKIRDMDDALLVLDVPGGGAAGGAP